MKEGWNKPMKKIVSVLLAVMILTSVGTFALASSGSGGSEEVKGGNSTSIPINGEYRASSEPDNIVVDVSWTGLKFTYHAEQKGAWLPDEQRYDNTTDAYWESSDSVTGAGKITFTNKTAPDVMNIIEVKLSFKSSSAASVMMKFASSQSALDTSDITVNSRTVSFYPNSYGSTQDVFVMPGRFANPTNFGTSDLGSITITIAATPFDPGIPEGPEIG